MPVVSGQMSLIGEAFLLILALVGIVSQSGKAQEKRVGVVVAFSWGLLLFSVLIILSNAAFSQLILNGFTSIYGSTTLYGF